MTTTSLARLVSLSLSLATLIFAAPAMAQGTQAQRDACTGDAMRLCSEFIPDPGRTGACLNAKKAQLSPDCRAVFGPVRKAKVKKTKHKTKVAKKKSRKAS
jgi:hypothetical protein